MKTFKWSLHLKQPTQELALACRRCHQCPDLTFSTLCREPVPGGGSPRGDPPPERLCVLRHSLQSARDGVSWGLWAAVLPAHPQQAAEIRLPVHRRLLVCGRGGETLGVWLPRMFLRPSAPPPLRLQLRGAATATWDPLETRGEEVDAGEEAEEENIKYIVK